MFENWVAIVGGILSEAEIPGFLANADSVYESVDDESADVKHFLAAWWAERRDEPVLAARLYETAKAVFLPLRGKDDHARTISLGRLLRQVLGRPYQLSETLTITVAKADTSDATARATLWRLTPVSKKAGSEKSWGPRGFSCQDEYDLEVSAPLQDRAIPPTPIDDGSDNLSDLSDLSAHGEGCDCEACVPRTEGGPPA